MWVWVVIVTPRPLLRRENVLCRHWRGGCVGSKAGLNALKLRKFLHSCRESDNDLSVFQSLYWLSSSGSLTWPQIQGMERIQSFFNLACQPLAGQGLLIIEDSRSHSDTPQSIGLFWTSDQSDTETSTWQHTPFTRDRHPCPKRDSNPQSQKASFSRQRLRPHHLCDRPLTLNNQFNNCDFDKLPHNRKPFFCYVLWSM
jgi:hypothetical protein